MPGQGFALSFFGCSKIMAFRFSHAMIFADKISLRQQPFLHAVNSVFQLIRNRNFAVFVRLKSVWPFFRNVVTVWKKSSVVFQLFVFFLCIQRISKIADIELCSFCAHLLSSFSIGFHDLDFVCLFHIAKIIVIAIVKIIVWRVASAVLINYDFKLLFHKRVIICSVFLHDISSIRNIVYIQVAVCSDF